MKNLAILILLLLPSAIFAQDTLITESDTIITNTGIIEVDQVEVIKAFEAKLIDAKKISINPKIEAIVPVDKTYEYDITIVPVKIIYPDPIIKPLAMNPDPEKPVKHFFTRMGYGDLMSPYADISYHNQKGDLYDYTISGHFYGADDSETIKFRKFYESDLNIDFGYRLGENHKLNVDLAGGYDLRNLYDTVFVNTPEVLNEEDVKRNIFKTKIHAKIANIEPTAAHFNYGLGLSLQRIQFDGKLESSENGVGIDLFLNNRLSSALTLFIKADGALHAINYPNGESNDRKAFSFNPGLNLSIGSFQLDASADIFVDDFGTSPFVDIRAAYSLADQSIQVYAGLNQVPIANTLWNHYINNPFVSGSIPLNKTTLSKQYYGGLSGKLKDFLTFNFMAGYADIKNQFFYDDLALLRLWVRHTDMTNIFINGNIEFKFNDNISLGANASQNFYDPVESDILVNTPEYKYSAYSKIKVLNERLTISTDLNLMDKISYIDNNGTTILGNTQIDLSLGLDLFITKNIGIWVRGNNLLNREYLRFSNYPEFGRNLLGGVIAKF
jgi:hypothetical protein